MDRGNYRGTTGGTRQPEQARQFAEPFGPRRGPMAALPGASSDEIRTRNRRAKARGGAFERYVAARLGGRRTGPLGGKDDVVVGDLFAIQCKKTIRPIYRPAIRRYLDALRAAFPTCTPMLAHARPGDNRNATATFYERDWLDLHGPAEDVPLTRDQELVIVPLYAVAELYGLDREVTDV